uniref:Uncharacterized protein n=1 Tax=Ditylenchus dipsaci TaxID=166011 RepID=A0A915DE85_9BILA
MTYRGKFYPMTSFSPNSLAISNGCLSQPSVFMPASAEPVVDKCSILKPADAEIPDGLMWVLSAALQLWLPKNKRILELLKLRLRGDLLDDLRRDSVWRNGSLNQFLERLKTSAAELVQEMQLLGLTTFQQEKRIVASFQESELQERRVSFSDQQPASPPPDSLTAYGQSPELRYDSQFRQPDFRYDDQYRKPAFRGSYYPRNLTRNIHQVVDLFNQKMFNAMLVMVLVILLTSVLTTKIEISDFRNGFGQGAGDQMYHVANRTSKPELGVNQNVNDFGDKPKNFTPLSASNQNSQSESALRKQIQELKDQLENSTRPESVCNVSSQPVQSAYQKSLPSSRLLLIPVTVEGHCYTALVDSGASQSIAIDRLAKKHNIKLNQNTLYHALSYRSNFNLQHRGAIQKLNVGHRPVFDLILGETLCFSFHPYTVDNQNKLFTMATSTLAFGRPRKHKDEVCPSAVEHIASLWSTSQIIDIEDDQTDSDEITSNLWNHLAISNGCLSQPSVFMPASAEPVVDKCSILKPADAEIPDGLNVGALCCSTAVVAKEVEVMEEAPESPLLWLLELLACHGASIKSQYRRRNLLFLL